MMNRNQKLFLKAKARKQLKRLNRRLVNSKRRSQKESHVSLNRRRRRTTRMKSLTRKVAAAREANTTMRAKCTTTGRTYGPSTVSMSTSSRRSMRNSLRRKNGGRGPKNRVRNWKILMVRVTITWTSRRSRVMMVPTGRACCFLLWTILSYGRCELRGSSKGWRVWPS